MNAAQNNSKKYGKGTLILAIVLSAIFAIGAWEALRTPSRAFAAAKYGIADPLDGGAQRQTQITEQKKTNTILRETLSLLKSGKMEVIIVGKKKGSKGKRR